MSTSLPTQTALERKQPATRTTPEKLLRTIAKRHFCTLATASASGAPHIAGVTYQYLDGYLYVATAAYSKKARNIRANPRVAVHIPVRQYPVGPPWSVQFQGTCSVLDPEDGEIVRLLESGKLKSITRLGVLEKEPDGCFLKIKPARKIQTYGLGLSLIEVIRDLPHGHRTVVLDAQAPSRIGGRS
jgi:nitroimidazol reductase NimA-like FMN-containing flavoprotein (pyridoxamine 5'-phosphate oxidase superfamily)